MNNFLLFYDINHMIVIVFEDLYVDLSFVLFIFLIYFEINIYNYNVFVM
jgi:hypothetical protein